MILFSEKILSDQECEIIKNYILDNEEAIKKLGEDKYPGTHNGSLTGMHQYFNFLNTFHVGRILIPKFRSLFHDLDPPVFIQCWANTFRKNQGIDYHQHGRHRFLCGNLFISGPTKPGTTYHIDDEMIDIENEVGVLTIFGSDLCHMVKPNTTDVVRITMAIDVLSNPVNQSAYLDPNRYYRLF